MGVTEVEQEQEEGERARRKIWLLIEQTWKMISIKTRTGWQAGEGGESSV